VQFATPLQKSQTEIVVACYCYLSLDCRENALLQEVLVENAEGMFLCLLKILRKLLEFKILEGEISVYFNIAHHLSFVCCGICCLSYCFTG